MHQPVVASHRKHSKFCRMLSQGCQGAKRDVPRHPSSGEVAADGLERIAAVQRTVHLVGGHVKHILLMLAQDDGGSPIPAQRRLAKHVGGVEGSALVRGLVGAHVPPKLITRVHHVVGSGVHFNLHAVATTEGAESVVAGLMPRCGFNMVVRSHPSSIVLEPAVDAVGFSVVHLHRIELADRRTVAFDPMVSTIP